MCLPIPDNHDLTCTQKGQLFVCTQFYYPLCWWGVMDCCGNPEYIAYDIVPLGQQGTHRVCNVCYYNEYIKCEASSTITSNCTKTYLVHRLTQSCKGAHTR